MVSEARVEANRNNPRTHGLSAPSIHSETTHPLYPERLGEWAAKYLVTSPEARFALETAVALTFRIDECRAQYREAVEEDRERGEHAWGVDREAEAAALMGRIARYPVSVAARLATTAQGVDALLGAWGRLAEALESGWGEWTDEQRSAACDLLGLAPTLRDGRLPFDPTEPGGDVREAHRRFAAAQIDRLKSLKENGLADLDRLARERAARGGSAMHSDRVRLVLRYEREAQRRYDAAMETVRFEHDAFCNLAYVATGEWPFRHYFAPATPAEPPMVVTVGALDPAPTSARSGDLGATLREIGRRSGTIGDAPSPVADLAPAPALPPNRHRRRAESAIARRG